MSDQDKSIPETPDASDERVRELACFYRIADLLEDPHADTWRILDLVVQAIPMAWQYPEACRAKITLEDSTFESSCCRDVSRAHKADIFVENELVGTIEVCCSQKDLQARGGHLSSEKCRFIDIIAKRLGSFLSLQHLLRLSASSPLMNREGGISDNHDSTDETGRPTPHETEYGGLCMTCVHSSTCAFPRRKDQPVLSCEEFDDREDVPAEPVGADDVLGGEAEGREESPEYLGLCATCENRETCTFPKPEGGIWQCEEFE